MTVARWRQLRIWGAQKTAIDRDMALQDPNVGPAPVRALAALRGTPESACAPELLLRYEIAFDRQFSRALTPVFWRFNPAKSPSHRAPTTRTRQPVKPGKKNSHYETNPRNR